MHYVAEHLYPNEPCFGVWEGPEVAPVPGGKNGETGWRWLQKVFVLRGDTIAKHISDLGPASDYPHATPLALQGDGDKDSVAMLLEMAERNRHDDYWAKRRQELIESSTLIQGIIEDNDIMAEWFHSRSVFGPAVSAQRDGPSLATIRRQEVERGRKQRGKAIYGG